MNIPIKRNIFKSNKETLKIFNTYNNINYITFYLDKTNNLYFILNKNEKLLFYNNHNILINLLHNIYSYIIIDLKNIDNINKLNFNYEIDLNKIEKFNNKKEIENYKNYIIELMKNYKI